MKLKFSILFSLMLILTGLAGATTTCNAPNGFNQSQTYSNVVLNDEKIFNGYHATYTGNDAGYSINYFISGNEFVPGNYYTVYNTVNPEQTYWDDICSYDAGDPTHILFELHTISFNVVSSRVTFQILTNGVPPTPTPTTPTPTPTSTIPEIPPTGTATAIPTPTGGGGIGPYTAYDPGNETGTYSHIPKESAGFNDVMKGLGYCTSGTCTGTDIVSFLSAFANTFWWATFAGVILRFWSLKPKPKGRR